MTRATRSTGNPIQERTAPAGAACVNVRHMKRTTIFLDPELEVLLKLEVLRQKRPMAELVRGAVHAYVTREPRRAPPGAGALANGVTDTAARAEAVLDETGFGAPPPAQWTRRRPPAGAGLAADERAARYRHRLRLLRPQR